MKRNASAHWTGSGKEGKGQLTTQSGVLNQTQYSFGSRFAEGIGTNPEELIAAAHAGCFTMKLSFNIGGAGFTPDSIDTKATVTLDPAAGEITDILLETTAVVPGLGAEKFDELVKDAEANCPVSKVLKARISVKARLTERTEA